MQGHTIICSRLYVMATGGTRNIRIKSLRSLILWGADEQRPSLSMFRRAQLLALKVQISQVIPNKKSKRKSVLDHSGDWFLLSEAGAQTRWYPSGPEKFSDPNELYLYLTSNMGQNSPWRLSCSPKNSSTRRCHPKMTSTISATYSVKCGVEVRFLRVGSTDNPSKSLNYQSP